MKLLLAHPQIDVNAQTKDGATPLIIAAGYGYIDIVRLLLKHPKINVNIQDLVSFQSYFAFFLFSPHCLPSFYYHIEWLDSFNFCCLEWSRRNCSRINCSSSSEY